MSHHFVGILRFGQRRDDGECVHQIMIDFEFTGDACRFQLFGKAHGVVVEILTVRHGQKAGREARDVAKKRRSERIESPFGVAEIGRAHFREEGLAQHAVGGGVVSIGREFLPILQRRREQRGAGGKREPFRPGGKKKLLVIDLAREDFGIPADILAEIKASGVFSKHIVKICCNENIRLAGACVRYVCDGDSITLDDGQIKCKNCPYPEVTFACEDGVVRYTANLAFARDRMTLVPKDKVVECECCKRNFYSEEKKDGFVCDFCRTAKIGIAGMDYSDYKEGNKLYRKYAGMLPLSLRVQNIRKHKYCKEDEDCILFILNKTTLIFYKEKLGEKGFLPSPEKIEL